MSRSYIIRDPLALHREGVYRYRGINVWRDNISVAEYVSEMLKPCLGPKGMYKLVINKFGDTVTTKDAAVILDKMELHHPVGKILRDAAKTIEKNVGDGAKTAIILIGELLRRAERLANLKIKVSKIIEGYSIAYNVALKQLEQSKIEIRNIQSDTLKKIFLTFFQSRNIDSAPHLAELTAEAAIHNIKTLDTRRFFERDNIVVTKKLGKSLGDSKLINGVIINKKIAHPSMPRVVKNAKIALLQMALKIDEFRHLQPYKYHITIKYPEDLETFLATEEEIVREMVKKIVAVGANLVICRKKIGPTASQLLADNGVMAISRVLREEDFKAIAAITGARVVSSLDDLGTDDLGSADVVRVEKYGDEEVIVIEGCKKRGGYTILLRGESERLLEEAEHAIQDALRCMSLLVENPALVAGGGAIEEELAIAIRNESLKYPGKEQIAMHAFANSIEKITQLLISNVGQDPLMVLPELRAKHLNGEHYYGFDQSSGRVANMVELSILEPYKVKEQVLKTAFETAVMLLRIDDVVDRRHAKRHAGELGGQ
jgi:chaperonin GroEL (HSP60 family)